MKNSIIELYVREKKKRQLKSYLHEACNKIKHAHFVVFPDGRKLHAEKTGYMTRWPLFLILVQATRWVRKTVQKESHLSQISIQTNL